MNSSFFASGFACRRLEEARRKAKEAEEMVEKVKREAEEEKARFIAEQKALAEEEARKKAELEAKKKKEAAQDEFGKGMENSKKAQLIKSMLNQQKDLHPMVEAGNASAVKKVDELQKKIDKLRKDLQNYGGWKSALYLSGGSVDLEFDLEPWPQKQVVAILQEMRKYLIKAMKEEKDAAGKAFREMDYKNLELEDSLRKSDRVVEKLRSQLSRLRSEIEKAEAEAAGKIEEERAMQRKGGTGDAEEMGREALLLELKRLQRQMYRERLGVNELLQSLDKLGDR